MISNKSLKTTLLLSVTIISATQRTITRAETIPAGNDMFTITLEHIDNQEHSIEKTTTSPNKLREIIEKLCAKQPPANPAKTEQKKSPTVPVGDFSAPHKNNDQ